METLKPQKDSTLVNITFILQPIFEEGTVAEEILNNFIINTSSVRFDHSGGMMSCFSRLKVFLKVKYLQDNYTLFK